MQECSAAFLQCENKFTPKKVNVFGNFFENYTFLPKQFLSFKEQDIIIF